MRPVGRLMVWHIIFSFLLIVPLASAAPRKPVIGKKGMVVAVEPLATKIGAEILKKGGNAIDAAVAVGFTLAVTHPSAGNIGGGGFMVIRMNDGTAVAVDYREKAPISGHSKMFLDANGERARNPNITNTNSKTGKKTHPYTNRTHHLAIGVPGTVAGFTLALEKYGTMSIKDVLQPAIELAEKGHLLTNRSARSINNQAGTMSQIPASKKVFIREDGKPWSAGDKWVQKDLAETLKRIAKDGHDGFYDGKTAELIEKDMMDHGGMITREDLAKYQAIIREPIRGIYRDEYEIIAMPPPSSGGITLTMMLNILEGYDLKSLGHNSSRTLHLMAESMRRAYADRAKYLGDADFVDIPVSMLTSKEYAAKHRATIDPYKATKSKEIGPELTLKPESTETTHFSVVDQYGNAVSNTYTLEGGYGSKIVIAGTGMLTNNEMGDFNPVPGVTLANEQIGTPPNVIEPEKRMLSSMTPTIVTKNGELHLVVGTPGGRTIINTTLQLILNVIDHGMNIQEAVDAPRAHHQWFPDRLDIERHGTPVDVIDALTIKGHTMRTKGNQGDAHSIMIDEKTGDRLGGPDGRIEGVAFGH